MAFREFTGELDAAAPSGPVREFTGELDAEDQQVDSHPPPDPSMGEVAMNAAGKGVGDVWQNAYDAARTSILGQVVAHGLEAITGNRGLTERPNIQGMAQQAGIVNPAHDPQTGPQRMVEAAIRGAVAAASVPGPNVAGTVRAGAMGAASGGIGQAAVEATRDIIGDTASKWLGIATGAVIPLMPLVKPTYNALSNPPQSPLNTKTRLKTLEAAQKEGFVVEPESVVPSSSNKLRSSIAGGGKLKIAAAMENQRVMTESAKKELGEAIANIKNIRVATEIGKKELGLPLEADLTPDTFKALKAEAGKPYKELQRIQGGADLLEQVQQKRSDAAALWRTYFNAEKPPPDLRKEAQAADSAVEQLEDAIDALAQRSGVPGLTNRIRAARIAFGKIYDVEAATNPGDAHVSLPYVGKAYREGKPLFGSLKVAGDFWNAFKPVAREGSSLGTTASGTDAASVAMLSTISNAGGSLIGTLAGAVPFARDWARNKSLSPAVQKSLIDNDTTRKLIELRPQAARGLTRSALIGSALANTNKGDEP